MTEHVTLDAFVPEEGTGPNAIATTYEWRPDGVICEACEQIVEARWREGDRFVCGSCKSWSEK